MCIPRRERNLDLKELFKRVFPVTTDNGLISLEYVHYVLEDPIETIEECIERRTTTKPPEG